MFRDWEAEYKLILNSLKEIEKELISVKSHIRSLAEYFYRIEFNEVGDWLWICSSIDKVDFKGERKDSAYEFCRPAYAYESEKQTLQFSLINELTLFLYTYSGFEALINHIKASNCPHNKGKVNAVTYLIKEHYSNTFSSLPYYRSLLHQLHVLIRNSSLNGFRKAFKEDDCVDINGLGLKLVYKLRNQLAHGDYNFPEPGDWSGTLPLEPEIVRLLTRILLMNYQMVQLCLNKNSFGVIEFFESEIPLFDYDPDCSVYEFDFLWGIHINSRNKNSMQLEIKFPNH